MSNSTIRGPVPDPWRPVNVTVPVSLANDLDQMQDVIKNVMDQLGCPTCHSGFDLRINIAKDFVVNPAGQVQQGVAISFGG
ncbi:hypothetical protein ABZZ17_09420 [Streptomyces sp. NPDC006512]|uniref:hypothetical protein n=1 Tax=Streptomyces sp. NPDC006512 TaxID=3154307 RepID=UPI0033A7894A